MIHTLTITCGRDLDFARLQFDGLRYIHHPSHGYHFISYEGHDYGCANFPLGGRSPCAVHYIRPDGFGCGCGFEASCVKIRLLQSIYDRYLIDDRDWLVSLDSDVIVYSDRLFTHLAYSDKSTQLMGFPHTPTRSISRLGQWSHLGGRCTAIQGDMLKILAGMQQDQLDAYRREMKESDMTENEDVVIPYILARCGAIRESLPSYLEERDVVHYASQPTEFAGVPVAGKWDIPKVLRAQGITFDSAHNPNACP